MWLDSDDKISKSTRAKTTLSKKNSSPTVRQPSRRSRKGEDKSEGRPKRVRSVTMPGGGENEVQKTSRRTSEQPKVTGTLSCNSQEQNTIHVDTEFTAAVLVGRRRRMEELLTGLPDTPNVNCYEEESAWRFYNPEFPEVETMSSKKGLSPEKLTELRGGIALSPLSVPISPDELPPLPPAAPLPPLPDTEFCDWSFDEESRVLLADFRVPSRRKMEGEGERFEVKVVREDEIFLLTMMERDDITVISQGLADEINSSIWSREYIESVIGSVYHHKFRGFQTMFREDGTISEQTMEKEGWYSMKFSDYFKYLEQRCSVKSNLLDTKDFTFIDSYGTTTTVDVDNEVLVRFYMHCLSHS